MKTRRRRVLNKKEILSESDDSVNAAGISLPGENGDECEQVSSSKKYVKVRRSRREQIIDFSEKNNISAVSPKRPVRRKITSTEATKDVQQENESKSCNVRRSSRKRFPPLDSWRNQRLVYHRSTSGEIICEVDEGTPEDDFAKRVLAKRRTKKAPKLSPKETGTRKVQLGPEIILNVVPDKLIVNEDSLVANSANHIEQSLNVEPEIASVLSNSNEYESSNINKHIQKIMGDEPEIISDSELPIQLEKGNDSDTAAAIPDKSNGTRKVHLGPEIILNEVPHKLIVNRDSLVANSANHIEQTLNDEPEIASVLSNSNEYESSYINKYIQKITGDEPEIISDSELPIQLEKGNDSDTAAAIPDKSNGTRKVHLGPEIILNEVPHKLIVNRDSLVANSANHMEQTLNDEPEIASVLSNSNEFESSYINKHIQKITGDEPEIISDSELPIQLEKGNDSDTAAVIPDKSNGTRKSQLGPEIILNEVPHKLIVNEDSLVANSANHMEQTLNDEPEIASFLSNSNEFESSYINKRIQKITEDEPEIISDSELPIQLEKGNDSDTAAAIPDKSNGTRKVLLGPEIILNEVPHKLIVNQDSLVANSANHLEQTLNDEPEIASVLSNSNEFESSNINKRIQKITEDEPEIISDSELPIQLEKGNDSDTAAAIPDKSNGTRKVLLGPEIILNEVPHKLIVNQDSLVANSANHLEQTLNDEPEIASVLSNSNEFESSNINKHIQKITEDEPEIISDSDLTTPLQEGNDSDTAAAIPDQSKKSEEKLELIIKWIEDHPALVANELSKLLNDSSSASDRIIEEDSELSHPRVFQYVSFLRNKAEQLVESEHATEFYSEEIPDLLTFLKEGTSAAKGPRRSTVLKVERKGEPSIKARKSPQSSTRTLKRRSSVKCTNGTLLIDSDPIPKENVKKAKIDDSSSLESMPNNEIEKILLSCTVCGIVCSSRKRYDMHLRGVKHKKKLNSIEDLESIKSQAAQSKQPGFTPVGKLLYCDLCSLTVNSSVKLQHHLNGTNHNRKLKQFYISKWKIPEKDAEPAVNENSNGSAVVRPLPTEFDEPPLCEFTCHVCNITVNSEDQLQEHLRGERHRKIFLNKRRRMYAGSQNASPSPMIRPPAPNSSVIGTSTQESSPPPYHSPRQSMSSRDNMPPQPMGLFQGSTSLGPSTQESSPCLPNHSPTQSMSSRDNMPPQPMGLFQGSTSLGPSTQESSPCPPNHSPRQSMSSRDNMPPQPMGLFQGSTSLGPSTQESSACPPNHSPSQPMSSRDNMPPQPMGSYQGNPSTQESSSFPHNHSPSQPMSSRDNMPPQPMGSYQGNPSTQESSSCPPNHSPSQPMSSRDNMPPQPMGSYQGNPSTQESSSCPPNHSPSQPMSSRDNMPPQPMGSYQGNPSTQESSSCPPNHSPRQPMSSRDNMPPQPMGSYQGSPSLGPSQYPNSQPYAQSHYSSAQPDSYRGFEFQIDPSSQQGMYGQRMPPPAININIVAPPSNITSNMYERDMYSMGPIWHGDYLQHHGPVHYHYHMGSYPQKPPYSHHRQYRCHPTHSVTPWAAGPPQKDHWRYRYHPTHGVTPWAAGPPQQDHWQYRYRPTHVVTPRAAGPPRQDDY